MTTTPAAAAPAVAGADTATADRDRYQSLYVTCVNTGERTKAAALAPHLGLSDAQVDAHFRVAHHADDEWVPDAFEDFDALPPDRFDARVFNQDTYWVDRLRNPYRIDDETQFTTEHLHAVIGFVQTEGWRWIDAPDTDDPTNTVESFRDALARAIRETPLMVALTTEADRRAGRSLLDTPTDHTTIATVEDN